MAKLYKHNKNVVIKSNDKNDFIILKMRRNEYLIVLVSGRIKSRSKNKPQEWLQFPLECQLVEFNEP